MFGPAQVEAQIDIDPEISAQITLWNQSGSTVVRGNLIVLPVGDSLIYIQPVYLRSTSAKFPAFERIVVASSTPRRLGGDARATRSSKFLAEEAGGAPPGPSPTPTPSPSPGATPDPGAGRVAGAPPSPPSGDVSALIDYANLHFERAEAALRNGDFATYGAEIELVRQALTQLQAADRRRRPVRCAVGAVPLRPSAAPSPAP